MIGFQWLNVRDVNECGVDVAIEWIFFDVGSVLVDDAPQDYQALKFFHQTIAQKTPGYTFDQLLAEREDLAAAGQPLILGQIAAKYLTADEARQVYRTARETIFSRYDDHNLLIPGVTEVLATLKEQYRLGILANQPPECRGMLSRRGLLPLFDVVAISEELGLRKPDPEIFHWTLSEASAEPSRCVMVGDRRDNDIRPAGELGLRTVWLHWLSHQERPWRPTEPDAQQFLDSCDRIPFHGLHENAVPAPDAVAHRWDEMAGCIELVDRRP